MEVRSKDDIIKILSPMIPEDIISNIASYLIMKIPKNDRRYRLLDMYMHSRFMNFDELFLSDGTFFGRSVLFSNGNVLLQRIDFKMYVIYQYKNMVTGVIHSDRCWFKLEDMNWRRDSTNYWQQHFIDGWIPNKNTYIIS
jgi:hypothetical protein